PYDLVEIRMNLGRQRVSILQLRADCLGAVDIEVGLAEYSGRVQRSYGIAMKSEVVFRADAHRDFDRRQLLVFLTHNADRGHIADIDSAQPYGRAHTQSTGIVEIRADSNSLGEKSGGARHEKQQQRQREAGDDHRETDA